MLDDLKDLPTRKPLADVAIMPHCATYICTHDTQPPEGQVIQTDQSTAALLRIVRKRGGTGTAPAAAGAKRGGAGAGPSDAAPGKRPRAAAEGEGPAASERPVKKAKEAPATAAAARPTLPVSSFTADELKAKTVPQLKELLKARGLHVSGTKDELIRRIVDHQRASKQK